MKSGSGPAGGCGLLPGPVVQFAPQLGVAGLSANPLKLAGAAPPLSVLSFHHCAPQNVTWVPLALLPSPIVHVEGVKTTTEQSPVFAMLPPSSTMWTLIVCGPPGR